jgi:hypothetical protein
MARATTPAAPTESGLELVWTRAVHSLSSRAISVFPDVFPDLHRSSIVHFDASCPSPAA